MSPNCIVPCGGAVAARHTQASGGTSPVSGAAPAGQALDALVARPTPGGDGPSVAAAGGAIAAPTSRATTGRAGGMASASTQSHIATLRRALAPVVPPLLVLGSLACLIGAARAYPCLGHNPTADQSFVVPGTEIFGTIHGWLSNCYDISYQCGTTSYQSCSTSNGVSRCTTTYMPVYCTATYTDRAPSQYVADFVQLVQACGGVMTQAGAALGLQRIAGNAEHGHWVRVATNLWNTTAGLDPVVACLHRI